MNLLKQELFFISLFAFAYRCPSRQLQRQRCPPPTRSWHGPEKGIWRKEKLRLNLGHTHQLHKLIWNFSLCPRSHFVLGGQGHYKLFPCSCQGPQPHSFLKLPHGPRLTPSFSPFSTIADCLGRCTFIWIFVTWVVLYILAELRVHRSLESIRSKNDQPSGLSVAGMGIFPTVVKTPSLHKSPAEPESTERNWSPRNCRTTRCRALREGAINVLIIHLELIKANLRIKVLQANRKKKVDWWCYVVDIYRLTSWTSRLASKLQGTFSIYWFIMNTGPTSEICEGFFFWRFQEIGSVTLGSHSKTEKGEKGDKPRVMALKGSPDFFPRVSSTLDLGLCSPGGFGSHRRHGKWSSIGSTADQLWPRQVPLKAWTSPSLMVRRIN